METMKGLHRTHGCGTISEAEVGKEVVYVVGLNVVVTTAV